LVDELVDVFVLVVVAVDVDVISVSLSVFTLVVVVSCENTGEATINNKVKSNFFIAHYDLPLTIKE
jgi:hypothetical protein